MELEFTVGKRPGYAVRFTHSKFWGSTRISVDGQTVFKQISLASWFADAADLTPVSIGDAFRATAAFAAPECRVTGVLRP